MSDVQKYIDYELLGKIKVGFKLENPLVIDGVLITPGNKMSKIPVVDFIFVPTSSGYAIPIYYFDDSTVIKVSRGSSQYTFSTSLDDIEKIPIDIQNFIKKHVRDVKVSIGNIDVRDLYTVYKFLTLIKLISPPNFEMKIIKSVVEKLPEIVGVYDVRRIPLNSENVYIFKRTLGRGKKQLIMLINDYVIVGDGYFLDYYEAHRDNILLMIDQMVKFSRHPLVKFTYDKYVIMSSNDISISNIINEADNIYVFVNEKYNDLVIFADGVIFRSEINPEFTRIMLMSDLKYSIKYGDVYEFKSSSKHIPIIKTDDPININIIETSIQNIHDVSITKTIGSKIYYNTTRTINNIKMGIVSKFAKKLIPRDDVI